MFFLGTYFWTSLNDRQKEKTWIWESTGQNLYSWAGGSGYANWADGEPNGSCNNVGDEDCVELNWLPGWTDDACSSERSAICEIH